MMDIFFPNGLRRDGDGWKLSARIRFVHSRIRVLLKDSEDWNFEAWGSPVSAAHVGFAISVFSKRLLECSLAVGAKYNVEEKTSVLAVWRYAGYLMGIPESILLYQRCRSRADVQDWLSVRTAAGCGFDSSGEFADTIHCSSCRY